MSARTSQPLSARRTYRGWDVHSYTGDRTRTLARWRAVYPRASAALDAPVDPADIHRMYQYILALDPALHPVLEKMRARTSRGAANAPCAVRGWFYADADLGGVNIWTVLGIAVELAQRSEGLDGLLAETLRDAGTTCVQGDSHRLFMFVLAAAPCSE